MAMMVAFFFRTSIGIAQTIRYVISAILLPFRLLMVLLGAIVVVGGRCVYAWTGWHRPMVQGTQWLIKFAYFLKGVHIPSITVESGFHISNTSNDMHWVLFAALPYKHLIICDDALFGRNWLNPWLFLLGFYPQEHGITVDTIGDYPFRVTDYVDDHFCVWQPISMPLIEVQSVAYVVMAAIASKKDIHVWTVRGAEAIAVSHWLNRQRITIQLVQRVPIARRLPVTMAAYYQTISQHFPEAQLRANQYQRRQHMKRSPRNPEISKTDTLSSTSDQSETEAPSPTV